MEIASVLVMPAIVSLLTHLSSMLDTKHGSKHTHHHTATQAGEEQTHDW